jgi:tRNA(fMet)-specific endonuclease VapC
MNNEIALDTNIAIALLNGDEDFNTFFDAFEMVYLPITTVGELLFGAMNSKRSKQNIYELNLLIGRCEILNINELIANEYANIRLQLKQIGRPIPENDIWIAATCKVNNIPLMTKDKHLTYVENLEIITI